MRNGFQAAKLRMLADPLAKRALAALDARAVGDVAQAIAAEDCYGERSALALALRMTGAREDRVEAVIEHQLWCAWRQARWSTGRISADEFSASLAIEGAGWVAETQGKPTILIAPMTLCTWDAVEAVEQVTRRLCGPREVIIYGEDMDGRGTRFVSGEDFAVLRQIARVLAHGGVFSTYPDFVHRGHPALSVRLFGAPRPMSTGFAYLAARPGTYLLPCLLSRRGQGVVAEISEPLVLEDASAPGGPSFQALAAQVVADALENLIRPAPEHWLLLPTLTFDAPEMAPRTTAEATATGAAKVSSPATDNAT